MHQLQVGVPRWHKRRHDATAMRIDLHDAHTAQLPSMWQQPSPGQRVMRACRACMRAVLPHLACSCCMRMAQLPQCKWTPSVRQGGRVVCCCIIQLAELLLTRAGIAFLFPRLFFAMSAFKHMSLSLQCSEIGFRSTFVRLKMMTLIVARGDKTCALTGRFNLKPAMR